MLVDGIVIYFCFFSDFVDIWFEVFVCCCVLGVDHCLVAVIVDVSALEMLIFPGASNNYVG